MAGHHDPRLLFSLAGIKAYHIQDGDEHDLTPGGPQMLSLLMVPTNSPFADLSTTMPQNEAPEEDFYLHLNLPPELDLSLPATTQIYHQPPRSYLIPRWDLGPESGAFTRIEFPPLGHGPGRVSQEDLDTFETILAQCTAFLEKAAPPISEKGVKSYNPADFKPGQGYVSGTGSGKHGEIVLIDEDNGSVVGELTEGAAIDDSKLIPGRKDPVEIEISPDGKRITVRPISEDYLRLSRHPVYKDSSLVQNAAAASRLIVTGSGYLSNMLASGANTFTSKVKPADKPMVFAPATHARARKINTFTQGAATFSSKTVGSVSKMTQNIGASLAGRGERKDKKDNESYKPGILNKSMIAFSTIADGIAYSGKHLLTAGGAAATQVVGHRWGNDAGSVAAELAGGVKNVGLVYIDVTGVSRRAIIKSVAKGMVVGKVKGGGEVVVGGGDGGTIPEEDLRNAGLKNPGVANNSLGGAMVGPSGASNTPSVVGFGNQAPPPSYGASSGVGENIAGQPAYGAGQYPPEKFR